MSIDNILQASFGVIQQNLNTGPGSLAAAQHLHERYMSVVNDVPHKTILFGDQLTVERMIQARRVVASEDTRTQRLLGLGPGFPQTWNLQPVKCCFTFP